MSSACEFMLGLFVCVMIYWFTSLFFVVSFITILPMHCLVNKRYIGAYYSTDTGQFNAIIAPRSPETQAYEKSLVWSSALTPLRIFTPPAVHWATKLLPSFRGIWHTQHSTLFTEITYSVDRLGVNNLRFMRLGDILALALKIETQSSPTIV